MGKHGKDRADTTRELPRLVDEPDRPTGERVRRAWPLAIVLGSALAAAVAIPAGAWIAGAADGADVPSAGFTYSYATTPEPSSPEPERSPSTAEGTGRSRPTATVTKKEIRYKPSPVPQPGPTITKLVPVPGPTKTITVRVTIKPKPKIVERTADRCFAVEFGEIQSEINCPEGN
jgi:hypothetical protein